MEDFQANSSRFSKIMIKNLLTLIIVGALSVSIAVEAKTSHEEKVQTAQVKSASKNLSSLRKDINSKVSKSKASSKAGKPLSNSENLFSSKTLSKKDSDFGISDFESLDLVLPVNLNIDKETFSMGLSSARISWSGKAVVRDYSISASDDEEALPENDEDFPISSGLTYSFVGGKENLASQRTLPNSRKTEPSKVTSTYGIKSSFNTNPLLASNLLFNGSQKGKKPVPTNAKQAAFSTFAFNDPKPLANVSFGTGYDLESINTQLGLPAEDLSDPSSQSTKGVSADLPLAGGSFNIGVSYVVGRLNGIFRDKSDLSDKYAEWVDDKYGLFTLNLSYSHPIGKQTTWYGYAGYTAGNKLYHNTEGFSNFFGGPNSTQNDYSVHIGLKHSF